MNEILIYDLEGYYICECNSSKEACELTNTEQSLLSKAVNGHILSANNLQFRIKKGAAILKIGDITSHKGGTRSVAKFYNEKLICTYNSITEASEKTNINIGSISRSLDRGLKAGIFIFKYIYNL